MKKSPYAAASIVGSALALLLEVINRAAPVATSHILPIGGDSFVQTAVVVLGLLSFAAVFDFFSRDDDDKGDTAK